VHKHKISEKSAKLSTGRRVKKQFAPLFNTNPVYNNEKREQKITYNRHCKYTLKFFVQAIQIKIQFTQPVDQFAHSATLFKLMIFRFLDFTAILKVQHFCFQMSGKVLQTHF
jgi:hypothetical protein